MAGQGAREGPYEWLGLLDGALLTEFHDIAATRGRLDRPGVRNRAALDHLASHLRAMGVETKPPEAIAAYAMWYVVMEQVFWDGNHRTAETLGLYILKLFDYDLGAEEVELARFVRSIDLQGLQPDEIRKWLRKKMVRAEEPT
ncbi:MAG: hypothetical protein QXO51_05605 [Halobacteria archaeon]